MSVKAKLFNQALKEMAKHNANIGAVKAIQQAIDFGIEQETPKLKADEMLSVKINIVPNVGVKVDVLRVKKSS